MACSSCEADKPDGLNDQRWRRVLWIALVINLTMFGGEIVGGVLAASRALQADALDFLGDAANYGISLGVAGMALSWRARAALLKGATILLFGLGVLASTVWGIWHGVVPHADLMGGLSVLALIANGGVTWMLYRFRTGDANMRSVWICSRNDAIGNIAVMFAALGVFGTGAGWPDLLVAAIMATLGITGGVQIIRQALAELRQGTRPAYPARAL